jgi:hypothetical protein
MTATARRAAETPRSRQRVLFVGNSFTSRNDLPGLVAALAAADGRRLEHRLVSAGGASLRRHWNAGEALREVRSGRYDRVVLQEQSTLPLKNPGRMHENVRLFDAEIRAAGARTVLYMTWTRRAAPEAQAAITAAYLDVARELGADVIPAGEAWARCAREVGAPELYDRDGSHPTPAGSYLAACAAYAVLFGRSPAGNGAEVPGLAAAEAQVLQRAAAAAVVFATGRS